jgi:hypothetical protein
MKGDLPMPLFPILPDPARLPPLMDHADGLLRRGGALSVGGHPAEGSTPEEPAMSESRFGDIVETLAKG